MTAQVPIYNLRSGTADKRPAASGLSFGQIAINYNEGDPAIYLRGHSDDLVKVSPVYIGSGAPNAVPASGGASGNSIGEQWLDTTEADGTYKVWDGSAWKVPSNFLTGTVSAGNFNVVSTGIPANGIYQPAADSFGVATSGTSRLVIDSSGKVGIGTTPDAPLHIKATGGSTNSINTALIVNYESTGAQAPGAGTAIVLRGSSGGGGTANYDQAQIVTSTTGSNNDHGLDFYTRRNFASGLVKRFSIDEYGCLRNYAVASTPVAIFGYESGESARIDSSGRLLVGTSTSANVGAGAGSLQQIFSNYQSELASFHLGFATPGAASPVISLSRSRSTTYGSYSIVGSGDSLGRIKFAGDDGTNYENTAAQIEAVVDGTPGPNDMPGRLVFSTTADGASSPTNRMTITNSGKVAIGMANTDPNCHLDVRTGVNNDTAIARFTGGQGGRGLVLGTYSANGNDGGVKLNASFQLDVVANSAGGVRLNQSATSWSALSDERLKTDLTEIENGLDKVGTLRAVTGRYINDSEEVSRSFLIAQDVKAVLPEAVSEEEDEDGTLSLRYSEVIPLLVAALKESKERIETLEARVTALEAS